MGLLDLSIIEMTQETKPIKGWVYRIMQNAQGCVIARCPADELLWSHGVIKQLYQPDEKVFVPACRSGTIFRIDLATALEVILAQ